MIRIKALFKIGILILILSACVPIADTPQPAVTPDTSKQNPASPTNTIEPTHSEMPDVSPNSPILKFSQPGPYQVGIRRNFTYIDASRGDRKVKFTIWYPAVVQQGSSLSDESTDAVADLSGAPYPLILSSAESGLTFAQHLVSYGFVYIGINGMASPEVYDNKLIDYPLDIIFALEQVSSNQIEGLEGMIDAEHAGTMGYSYDGATSLILSGVRIDPDYYINWCKEVDSRQPPLEQWYIDIHCTISENWSEFSANAGAGITESTDGLWQQVTDPRIKAVMPMAPDGAWFLGEKGLAAADRPVLMIQASKDSQYQPTEGAFIFEHLGTPDKTMVSFIGATHNMVWNSEHVASMSHFATAFFGYYLQRHDDYKQYFSEDYIAQFDGIAYGFYKED